MTPWRWKWLASTWASARSSRATTNPIFPCPPAAEWTIGELVKELVEWNERQPYSYSREQLSEMIGAAMASSK